MTRLRIELDRAAVRAAALTSEEVRAEIAARAERIADSARSKTDDDIVTAHAGRSRARSYVRRLGSGQQGEAKDRALGSSLDAGRS